MITEDYVSFETARLLKEKGFNVPDYYCSRVYSDKGTLQGVECVRFKEVKYISAPTLQMAMKWLREVHKLYVEVYILKHNRNKTVEYCITIEDLNFPSSNDGFHISPSQESYEEACEVGIKYCLKHLI